MHTSQDLRHDSKKSIVYLWRRSDCMQDYFYSIHQKMLRMYRCRNRSGSPDFSPNDITLQSHQYLHICMRISYRRWQEADKHSYLLGDIVRITSWDPVHIKSKWIVFSSQIGNIKLFFDKGCELSADLWGLHVLPSVQSR